MQTNNFNILNKVEGWKLTTNLNILNKGEGWKLTTSIYSIR